MLSVPTRTQPLGENGAAWAKAFLKVPKPIAIAAAPEEMRNARREIPWNTIPSNSGFIAPLCLLHFARRALDRGDDVVVGAAAADVALHVLDDLLARRLAVLLEQCGRGHDLPRLAVAALRHLLRDP